MKVQLGLFGIVVGCTLFHIIVPLWLTQPEIAMNVLIVTGMCYIIIFALLELVLYRRICFDMNMLVAKAGVCDALNSLCIMYSSDPQRVVPSLQPLLSNTVIIFGIATNKWLNEDKRQYNTWYVYIAVVCIFASVIIMNIAENNGSITINLWTLLYLVGAVFYSCFNTYQSKFLLTQSQQQHIVSMLKTHHIVRMVTIILFAGIDFIPSFGYNQSVIGMLYNVTYLKSYFIFMLYNAGNTIAYIGAALVNANSAPYGMIIMSLVVPITIILWMIFPQLNASGEVINIAAGIISLALSMLGVYVWHLWEKKNAYVEFA